MVQNGRRQFLKLAGGAGALGVTGFAGCLGPGSGAGGGETAANIGMVYALGGLGDKSFNDMANTGIKRAEEELNIAYNDVEPESDSEFETMQRQFARSEDPNYDLVCCIGFAQTTALTNNAPEFPDQKFTLIDSVAEDEDGNLFENVENIVFKEHQGSFQVGYLAGLLSTRDFSVDAPDDREYDKIQTNDDKVVGFVGGMEVPLIKKFEAGFIAGAKHADSNIEVRSAYAGSWSDPSTGKGIANSMYDEGADVIYHAAGGTGSGVFAAAQERGRFAIGVDSDQSRSAPEFSDVIVASMVKHVDTAVYGSVERVLNEEFKGGSVTELGLGRDGVEAVIGQDFEGAIPDDVLSKLDESEQAIANGEIDVPRTPEDN